MSKHEEDKVWGAENLENLYRSKNYTGQLYVEREEVK